MKAIHLRTEYLEDPLGLGITGPGFYWKCQGGIRQTAYRIIAKAGAQTLWNSGKVESASMTHMAEAARELGREADAAPGLWYSPGRSENSGGKPSCPSC